MEARRRQTALDLLGEAAREGQLSGRSFRVRGGCMAPLLADGDVVTLASEGPLLPGHVVLARAGEELLCHRLLSASGDSCEVAGDTDLRLDRLTRADVLGRVSSIDTPRFGGARLDLPVQPSRLERFLATWQLWACRSRGKLQRRLEGLRLRQLRRLATQLWHRCLSSTTT